MRIMISLSLCLILAVAANSQSMFSVLHLNDERDYHQGTPLSIKVFTVFYSSNGTEKRNELTEYDRSGLPVTKKRFDEEGNITSITNYRYDTIRRILLETRLTEIKVRFPTDRIQTVYHYEKDNSPTAIRYFNAGGTLLCEVLLKNDTLGMPVELKLFEPPGNLIGMERASYIPEENKAIVSVLTDYGAILTTDTMKVSFKKAHKFNSPVTSYNEKSDVVSSESKWPNGEIHYSEYEYIYDEKGNWTEQKAFEVTYKGNGKKKRELKSTVKRQIVYW